MKTQKQVLNLDNEYCEILIGLLSPLEMNDDHEFFFKLNSINTLQFYRTQDLKVEGDLYTYFFPVFETYCSETKSKYRIIRNLSSHSNQKNTISELFALEEKYKYLLEDFKNFDYFITNIDHNDNFCLFLQVEKLAKPIENYRLSSDHELYQTLHYYE